METLALVLSIAALALALAAWLRAGGGARAAEDVRAEQRRRHANQSEELGTAVEGLRELVARLAAGESLDPDQIREGRLWRDLPEADARAKVDAGEVRVLDVRTHRETSGGTIPGALRIPVDELEARHHELPKDGAPTLVVCAMGVRSAAACEFLAGQGYFALYNLDGGMTAWRGEVQPPG